MTTLRLTLRLHRFELVSVALAAILVAVAAFAFWRLMADIGPPVRCIEDRFLDPVPVECLTTDRWLELNEESGKVMAAMAVLPFAAGVLLGVSLVAREVEQRTASIAWSLAPSRRRWFLARFGLLAAILAGLLAVPAIGASLLESARTPWLESAVSFNDYALRGPLVVSRGLVAFGAAVLAGAVLGRVLPAVIVGGASGILAWNLLALGLPFGQPIERLPDQDFSLPTRHDLVISIEEFDIENPVLFGVPGERLREVETREAALLGGGLLALMAASTVVVGRRRPY